MSFLFKNTFFRLGIARLIVAVIGIGEFLIGCLVAVYAIGQIALIVFEADEIVAAFGHLALAVEGLAYIVVIASDEIVGADRFRVDAIEHNVIVFTFAFRQSIV